MTLPALAPQPQNIPLELRALQQWVVWCRVDEPGKEKYGKVLYNPRTGKKASTTDPNTWTDFDTALRVYQNSRNASGEAYAGIGFVFAASDPFAGLDLDCCIDPATGEIAPWADDILRQLNTYAEVSPSGTGIKLICRATLRGKGNRKDHTEFYDRARFFTVTGHVIGDHKEVADRDEPYNALHARIFTPRPSSAAAPQRPAEPVDLSDADLLEKARRASNGPDFAALYDRGDTSAYNGDESRADLALCGMLLFWTGGDQARAEALFAASVLGQREKWRDRSDYRQRTLQKAAEGKTEFYNPNTQRSSENVQNRTL